MRKHPDMEFHTAKQSAGANCVAVGFHKADESADTNCLAVAFSCVRSLFRCRSAHVRNSRHPERVVKVGRRRWARHALKAIHTGTLDLNQLFPKWRYGDFAATFTEGEQAAFLAGLIARQDTLLGPSFG